jgi:hypothetical protein
MNGRSAWVALLLVFLFLLLPVSVCAEGQTEAPFMVPYKVGISPCVNTPNALSLAVMPLLMQIPAPFLLGERYPGLRRLTLPLRKLLRMRARLMRENRLRDKCAAVRSYQCYPHHAPPAQG